jgi:hypothetical protein
MKSKMFYEGYYKEIQFKIKNFLNSKTIRELDIPETVRTTGDKIPEVLGHQMETILKPYIRDFSIPVSNKSIADYEFLDNEGFHNFINVITHREETLFSMPNITSVDRLKKLYENDKNIFVVLLIDYSISKPSKNITNVRFIPIEFYDWDCLTLGALGSGQIQIRKASDITEVENNSRKDWMLEFFERLDEFYVNEADKTVKRLKSLISLRTEWKAKKDIWES